MDNGSASPAVTRLLLVADTTLVSVLERNRLKSLDLEPSASEEAEIQRNLQTLRDGIAQLEREQSAAELDSGNPSRAVRAQEDILIRLQMQFDKLLTMLQEGGADQLISKVTAPKRPSLVYTNSNGQDEIGSPRRNGGRKAKTVRFSDNLIDVSSATPDPLSLAAEEARNSVSNSEAMMQQQRIMREQDDSLDRLSESISRQRELSIQIGDELDQHVELLSDVDRLVDWSHHRLNGARKRLDNVSRKMKQNGSVLTIVLLIIVLLILIIILKCMFPLNFYRTLV
ncbi:syntaxin-61 [Kockiozyma suomiensis]|uniref:syntaxin-61 n=1 Tax=Kockiozyma suomiensis TaxID=1337062 RepID=UPI0033438253